MDDDQSTNDAVDTSVDDSASTSTNEEAQETDDIALEDMEISDDEVDETDETDESEDDSQASEESDDSEEESDDDVQADDASQEDESESEDDKKKRQAREMYERRQAERTERLRQKELQQAQENVRLEQYLKDAEGDDAELAVRQAEVDRLLLQRERIAMNEERLQIGVEKALNSIELFRTGSPEVKEELANAVDDFIAMHVELNQNGDPVAVNGDITAFLQRKADSIRRIQGVGVRQAVKDKQATKARTITVPSRTPKTPKVDEDLKDFDDGWN